MDKNDFRYMRRGQQLRDLADKEFDLLQPINQRGPKKNRALFMLHGFGSSPAAFRYLVPHLTHYDAIVAPVLPGHAASIATLSQIKPDDWLASIAPISEQLLQEYHKVDILGLSLGGLLACKLCERFTFNHLFLLAPALKLLMNIKRKLALANTLICLGFKEVRFNAGSIANNTNAEIAYRRLPIPAVRRVLALIDEYQFTPPTCPTDLFFGVFDKTVASTEVEKLFVQLPNTRIHWLKNSAHILPLDNDLDDIIQCINEVSGESNIKSLRFGARK